MNLLSRKTRNKVYRIFTKERLYVWIMDRIPRDNIIDYVWDEYQDDFVEIVGDMGHDY